MYIFYKEALPKTQCLNLRKQKSNAWELRVETWELSWESILIPPQKVSHLSASPDPRTPLVHHNHISPNTNIYKNHYQLSLFSPLLIFDNFPPATARGWERRCQGGEGGEQDVQETADETKTYSRWTSKRLELLLNFLLMRACLCAHWALPNIFYQSQQSTLQSVQNFCIKVRSKSAKWSKVSDWRFLVSEFFRLYFQHLLYFSSTHS